LKLGLFSLIKRSARKGLDWQQSDSERLGICLRAFSGQGHPEHKFEVIVVDPGSQDQAPWVAPGNLRTAFVQERKPGSYRARNAVVYSQIRRWLRGATP